MATHTRQPFAGFQSRSVRGAYDPNSLRNRMRMPAATLALGFLAAVAIAGGALDNLVSHQLSGGLSDIEFLTATLPGLDGKGE